MKRLALVAGLAFGLLSMGAVARAQDEPAGGTDTTDGTTPDGTTPSGDAAAGGDAAGGEAGGGGEMAAEAPKPLHFDVAAVVDIPVSPSGYTDVAGIGIGAVGGVDFFLNPKLALAGHVGLVYHLAKNDITLMEIPILAGVRFMVMPNIAIGADTGINIMRFSGDPLPESQTNTRIPLGLHGAYMLPNGLAFGAGLWIPNLLLTEDGEDMGISIFGFVGKMF